MSPDPFWLSGLFPGNPTKSKGPQILRRGNISYIEVNELYKMTDDDVVPWHAFQTWRVPGWWGQLWNHDLGQTSNDLEF